MYNHYKIIRLPFSLIVSLSSCWLERRSYKSEASGSTPEGRIYINIKLKIEILIL